MILGRALTQSETESIGKHLELLVKWQKTHRFIGSDEPSWIVENLFLDSLLFLKVLPGSIGSLLDLGAGAGFPGVPIKIVKPEIELTLVESRRRRASFLAALVRELALERTRVLNVRAEKLFGPDAPQVDAVVMRCAGSFASLLSTALGLVRSGGLVVASGPPEPEPISPGEWVEVQNPATGRLRRFAVCQRA